MNATDQNGKTNTPHQAELMVVYSLLSPNPFLNSGWTDILFN